ncbi:MAG: WhiB family transcriptional regulator [Ilumatobacteraceae bacterium]
MIRFNITNGLCRGKTDTFFPPQLRSKKYQRQLELEAKKICQECPEIDECREYAILHETFGVWGGMTELERKRERSVRRITVIRPEMIFMHEMLTKQRVDENGSRKADYNHDLG